MLVFSRPLNFGIRVYVPFDGSSICFDSWLRALTDLAPLVWMRNLATGLTIWSCSRASSRRGRADAAIHGALDGKLLISLPALLLPGIVVRLIFTLLGLNSVKGREQKSCFGEDFHGGRQRRLP